MAESAGSGGCSNAIRMRTEPTKKAGGCIFLFVRMKPLVKNVGCNTMHIKMND